MINMRTMKLYVRSNQEDFGFTIYVKDSDTIADVITIILTKQQIKRKTKYGINCHHLFAPVEFFESNGPAFANTRAITDTYTVGEMRTRFTQCNYTNCKAHPIIFLETRLKPEGI